MSSSIQLRLLTTSSTYNLVTCDLQITGHTLQPYFKEKQLIHKNYLYLSPECLFLDVAGPITQMRTNAEYRRVRLFFCTALGHSVL